MLRRARLCQSMSSVRLSVRDVEVCFSHRLESFENNLMASTRFAIKLLITDVTWRDRRLCDQWPHILDTTVHLDNKELFWHLPTLVNRLILTTLERHLCRIEKHVRHINNTITSRQPIDKGLLTYLSRRFFDFGKQQNVVKQKHVHVNRLWNFYNNTNNERDITRTCKYW